MSPHAADFSRQRGYTGLGVVLLMLVSGVMLMTLAAQTRALRELSLVQARAQARQVAQRAASEARSAGPDWSPSSENGPYAWKARRSRRGSGKIEILARVPLRLRIGKTIRRQAWLPYFLNSDGSIEEQPCFPSGAFPLSAN